MGRPLSLKAVPFSLEWTGDPNRPSSVFQLLAPISTEPLSW